jgi:hypothetical protein
MSDRGILFQARSRIPFRVPASGNGIEKNRKKGIDRAMPKSYNINEV